MQGLCMRNLEEGSSMSPLIFDKKNSDTSERVADTVASMVENFVKQFKTICKKVLLLWSYYKNFQFI